MEVLHIISIQVVECSRELVRVDYLVVLWPHLTPNPSYISHKLLVTKEIKQENVLFVIAHFFICKMKIKMIHKGLVCKIDEIMYVRNIPSDVLL